MKNKKSTLVAETQGEGVAVKVEGTGSRMKLLEMYSAISTTLIRAGVDAEDLVIAGSYGISKARE